MKKKRCGKCFADVQSTAIYCPHCGIVDSWLPTPQESSSESLTEIWRPEEQEATTPPVSEQTTHDVGVAKRAMVDSTLGEEKVAQYRARLAKEIEEIKYQEWRAIQPEWQKVAEGTRQYNPSSPFQNPMIATAAGVMLGTTAMRYQLGTIQNELGEENVDPSGATDTSGGFMDGFDGGF
jgi:predicted  nucleic acid-binding Zn-ribbon protein